MNQQDAQRVKNEGIRILILGSYKEEDRKRLLALREKLIKAGFGQTRLVEEFPDEKRYSDDLDIHFTKKSEHYLSYWADLILFVLFRDSDNQGVLSEFRFCSITRSGLLRYSLVLVEEGVHLSSQVRGPIKITRINTAVFRSDASLHRLALGHIVKTAFELHL
jgi:hypothetical protein